MKLKKHLLIIAAIILFQCSLSAEEIDNKNNAVSIGMGFLSIPDFEIIFEKTLDKIDKPEHEEEDNTFARFISYDRVISGHFSLGGIYIYQRYRSNKVWDDGRFDYSNEKWYTFMPRLKAFYGDDDVHIYHSLAIGGSIYNEHRDYSNKPEENNQDISVAFQLTFLGLELDIGNARLYTDFGFGMQGIWTFGAALIF